MSFFLSCRYYFRFFFIFSDKYFVFSALNQHQAVLVNILLFKKKKKNSSTGTIVYKIIIKKESSTDTVVYKNNNNIKKQQYNSNDCITRLAFFHEGLVLQFFSDNALYTFIHSYLEKITKIEKETFKYENQIKIL